MIYFSRKKHRIPKYLIRFWLLYRFGARLLSGHSDTSHTVRQMKQRQKRCRPACLKYEAPHPTSAAPWKSPWGEETTATVSVSPSVPVPPHILWARLPQPALNEPCPSGAAASQGGTRESAHSPRWRRREGSATDAPTSGRQRPSEGTGEARDEEGEREQHRLPAWGLRWARRGRVPPHRPPAPALPSSPWSRGPGRRPWWRPAPTPQRWKPDDSSPSTELFTAPNSASGCATAAPNVTSGGGREVVTVGRGLSGSAGSHSRSAPHRRTQAPWRGRPAVGALVALRSPGVGMRWLCRYRAFHEHPKPELPSTSRNRLMGWRWVGGCGLPYLSRANGCYGLHPI